MKKLKYFVLLCLVAIISTGCVKYNATMKINKDKSMDFTIIYALDKSLMSMGGESSSLKEEDFEEVKKAGYTVEKYSQDNYEGFKMTKKISNIDEVSTDQDVEFSLSGMMEESSDNKYMFKVVKNGEKSTYYAKFTFDSNDSSLNNNTEELDDDDDEGLEDFDADVSDVLPDEEDDTLTTTGGDDLTSGMDLSALTGNMDLSFKVNLPNAAISSNATNKENDNKDLTWKLNANGSQTIEFAFELDANAKSDSNLILYIGIGVGVLLVLVLLIFLLTRKKGNKEVVPVADNKVEVNNAVNEAVQQQPVVNQEPQVVNQEPIVSEQSQVVNETEQKDA